MVVDGKRGAVLLAELKALVDSFPHQQRAGVIRMIETTFKELKADFHSRHSVDRQLEARTAPGSPSPKSSPAVMNFKTKIKNEE